MLFEDLVCSKTAFTDPLHRSAFGLQNLQFLEIKRKLLKQDGTSRISNAERQRLISRLLKHPERYKSDDALAKLVQNHEREKARKEKKHDWELRDLSTTKALDCGRGVAQHVIFDEYQSTDLDWIDSLPTPEPSRPPYPYSTEYYPELDIKVMLERYDLESDRVTARSLGWPSEATDDCTIYMFVDGRFEGLPRLVFIKVDPETNEKTWQKISLLSGPTSDKARYFLCPLTHARCETIYFRNGVFASRQAHRLKVPKNWSLAKIENKYSFPPTGMTDGERHRR